MRETYSGPTMLALVMATLCFPARVCMKPLVHPCILALPPKQASMPHAVLFLSFVLCSVWMLFGLFGYLFIYFCLIWLSWGLFIILFFFLICHYIQFIGSSFPKQGRNLSPKVESTESCPQGILISVNSPGGPYHSTKSWFLPPAHKL